MGLLLMAMTIGGLIVAAILLVVSLITKKTWLTRFTLGGVAVWTVLYAALLLGTSFTSQERTIEVGDTDGKAFCGFYLDCHMHVAVMDVRSAKTLGSRTANGQFYVIKVKVFSNAVKAELGLTDLSAHVIDGGQRRYFRDLQAEEQLESAQPTFETRVGPEQSFEKEIVFDVPSNIASPRLDVRQGFIIDRVLETVLIGDEDSILHKRQLFELTEQNETAGVK